jgi:hypothetical protein
MKACPHAHGEYRDDYRHCTDCGAEWVLIGGNWCLVEAWIRLSTQFMQAEEDAARREETQG